MATTTIKLGRRTLDLTVREDADKFLRDHLHAATDPALREIAEGIKSEPVFGLRYQAQRVLQHIDRELNIRFLAKHNQPKSPSPITDLCNGN